MKDKKALFTSKSDEWNTPQYLYDHLNEIYNFELDPCTNGTNSKAPNFYTAEQDGLTKEWDKVTFCNPPYSNIKEWVRKANEEYRKHGKTIVLLIPSRTDTQYWHEYIFNQSKIIFIKGRLKFGDATNAAPFPSAIIVFGEIGVETLENNKIKEIK